MEYLKVYNVGPIKKAKLNLKKINIFIGKNGSGKSVIAKLLQVKRENESFKDYGLDEFITNESKIEYKGYTKNGSLFEKIINDIKLTVLSEEKISEEFHKILKTIYSQKQSFYIPVERNLVPFFSSYGINIMASKIPLPQYVLDFATEFRLAKDMIKQKEILQVKYKFENEEDKIFIDENNFISLKNASSGLQTLLPLYLTIEYLNNDTKRDYILEEPELNLFPKEQFEVVKFMVENSKSCVFVSHSPYVLFSLNILLFAQKVGSLNEKAKKEVEKIIPSKYWIDTNEFSAYYFEEGEVKSFFDEMLEDNLLDNASNELEEIFDELSEIYKVFNEV